MMESEFNVYWVGLLVGRLSRVSGEWSFSMDAGFELPLSVNNARISGGSVPYILESILPEANGQNGFSDGVSEFLMADRYVSNIIVRKSDATRRGIIIDKLGSLICNFTDDQNQFTGKMSEMLNGNNGSMYKEIHSIVTSRDAPRMSGVQVKIPCNLDDSGSLSIALSKSFTHIIKLPGDSMTLSSMGSMEWFSMSVAKMSGVNTCNFCLGEIDGLGPIFIAERFDIRGSGNKDDLITEEICSCLGRMSGEKYYANMIDVAEVVLKHSTSPKNDAEQLIRQTALSWVIGNSDMHLKNLMLLKTANGDFSGFSEIRLSPAYDIMHTIVYPNGADMSFALNIDGESYFNRKTFEVLGKSLGFSSKETCLIISDVISLAEKSAQEIYLNLPKIIKNHKQSIDHIGHAVNFINSRCAALKMQLIGNDSDKKSRVKIEKELISFGF